MENPTTIWLARFPCFLKDEYIGFDIKLIDARNTFEFSGSPREGKGAFTIGGSSITRPFGIHLIIILIRENASAMSGLDPSG